METSFFLGQAARRRVANPDLYEESNYGNSSLEGTEQSNLRETNLGSPSLVERDSSNPDFQEESNYGNSCPGGTEQSNLRADDGVPDIFLSHSGAQKPFVERLYDSLRSANHTAFFDQHSLERGVPFPPRILKAAKGCKIGVVVLSEEFLTSKWPMVELEMLVLQRGNKPCVLPLFYKLKPADLSSQENLSSWKGVWKDKAGEKNDASKWEQAVKVLRPFNGELFIQGSEGAYIKRVVQRICALIPCHVRYDCSYVQGQPRLTKEIVEKFEHLDGSKARMVGLHGVGGLGKTTLCKVMANYYSSCYHGKSFLLEFPSPGGGSSSTIASECKKALHKLTGASDEHLLNEAYSFDQVVKVMGDRMGHHDVFLAIDNVWESSLEEAKRVLGVDFNANSNILVTSRSEQVLKKLLMVRGRANNAIVAPLPAPKHEEAFQIFQENFDYDLSALKERSQMYNVLMRCNFTGSYHALALKALAKYVDRVFMDVDSKEIEHKLFGVLEEISAKDLSDVKDVIRLSYDNLPEEKKHVFIDIVVFWREYRFRGTGYAEVQEWISSLNGDFHPNKTTKLINELSLDGVIQIEVREDGTKIIGLHDLYRELGLREVASSPRLLIGGITKSVKHIEREKLEIVCLKEVRCDWLFEELQRWKSLKAFIGHSIVIKSGIWLDSMPSLSVLRLEKISHVENELGSASTSSGSASETEEVAQSHILQQLLEQESTIKISSLGLVRGTGLLAHASRILHLHGLVKLQILEIYKCSFVEEIAGLDALGNLQRLEISICRLLKSLDGLSGLVQLQVLRVEYCASLQKLPDVSGLTCLESLTLLGNKAMGGEYLSSTLKHCRRSSLSWPSLDKCMHLETLSRVCAHHISSIQKLPNLRTSLRYLSIDDCLTIKKIDAGCFTNLGLLRVSLCEALEEIGDLSALSSLWSLIILHLPSLKKLNAGCSSLKMLFVHDCEALEIIGDFSALPSLKDMDISWCPSLKTLQGISSTPLGLCLSLKNCKSLPTSSIPKAIVPDIDLQAPYFHPGYIENGHFHRG